MKLLKYKIAGALYQSETGPQAQVGDQVKLFLDTESNPQLPEFVFGIIQPGIKLVECDSYTLYTIEYELEDFTLHQDDVLYAEVTSAVDVLALELSEEVAARIADVNAEEAARITAVAAEAAARIAADALLAPKASPAFTGNPTAPTPVSTDNDTSVATTAFVQAQPVVKTVSQSLNSTQLNQVWTNLQYGVRDNTGTVVLNTTEREFATDAVLLYFWDDTGFTFSEAVDFSVGTSTGSKFGTTTTQKLSFHGATPVAQRSGAAQVAVAATAATNVTPYGFTTQAQADAVVTLLNEIRAALVQKGLIKGSV